MHHAARHRQRCPSTLDFSYVATVPSSGTARRERDEPVSKHLDEARTAAARLKAAQRSPAQRGQRRQRDLGNDECQTQTPPHPERAAAVLQRFVDVLAREVPRGEQTKEQAGADRQNEREGQHARIESDVRDAQHGHALRRALPQQLDAPLRHEDPSGAPAQREQDALGQRLSGEPQAAGAERRADAISRLREPLWRAAGSPH